ncbi:hypothetical protein [Desulfurobacterium sp.]
MRSERLFYALYLAAAVFVFFFFIMHNLMMHIKPLKEALHPHTPYFIYILDFSILVMLYHGLYGIRSIVIEKKGYSKNIDLMFAVVGVILAVVLIAAKHKVI